MQLTINKKKFESHLENISKAIQSNSPLPSLQGIMITATESNIQLLASNGNLSIKEIINPSELIIVKNPGKALVPGGLFAKIIKQQGKEISIITEKNSMVIESDGAKTSIQLLDHNDYPVISFESIGRDLVVDGNALEKLIKNVSFAAADNDKRIILNGVNLKSSDGYLTATATNSFRLAQEKIQTESNVEFEITILSKNLKNFMPKSTKEPLTINVNDSKIITKYDTSTIMSKLIDGVYPRVDSLIPKNFKYTLKINSKLLSNLIDKATVVSSEGNKVVRMVLNQHELTVESKRAEVGSSLIKTSDHKWMGEELSIALNSQFLKEAIGRFASGVVIGFNSPQDAIVVRGEENTNLVQLILPHRSY